jgi:four helix bundle protein
MIENKDKKLFRFLEWEVYKNSQDVFMDILRTTRGLPQDLRYTLGSQIIRSALSVILNIAEGSGRVTNKEMGRFFDISIGSVNETMAGLDSLLRLKIIDEGGFTNYFRKYESVSRQLGGFKKKLSQP